MLAIVNLQRPVPYLYLGLGGRLVDIGGLHIPTLGSAAATFGAVYATFARFDRVQSRNNRRFVSRWLKGLTLPRDETWNDFFLELFTYLFGPRHLSLRCAVTSVLLSIFLVTLILAVTGFLSQETVVVKYGLWMPLIITPEDKRRIAVYLVVVGCVCDYLSLWKTRFLLTRVRSASFARLLCLAFGDFAATTLLYLLVRVAIITMVELYQRRHGYHPERRCHDHLYVLRVRKSAGNVSPSPPNISMVMGVYDGCCRSQTAFLRSCRCS